MNCSVCGKESNGPVIIISNCYKWTCGECSEKQEEN